MKRFIVVMVAVAACDKQHTPEDPAQSTSTLALSQDDTYLYAVDADSELLAVVDTRTDEKVAEVKLRAGAHLVTVGPDDTLYVANRYDGSVSVVHRGEWSEAARWSAGIEPVGLTVSLDGKTLYVVSAVADDTASHGALLALDAATGAAKWSLAIGPEPRGIALVGAGHAAVALMKEGDVQLVDLATPAVERASTDTYDRMNKTSLATAAQNPNGVDFQHARALSAIVTSPGGEHVHALGVTARSGPQNAWGGCAGTLLAAPAMFSFDPQGSSLADDVFTCQAGDESVPRTVLTPPGVTFSGENPNLIQGPSAVAIERSGRWMYLAQQHSNNVALISTVSDRSTQQAFGFGVQQSVDAVVAVGRGPNGIAVRRDGTKAYVLNAFDHTVSVLGDDGHHGVTRTHDIAIGADVLPADVVAGRKLFFDATDSRMTGATLGAACATCHIDNGQEDGHVWTFAEGSRQTMSLAGRLAGTAPFHWDGTLEDMDVLMRHTTTERMGGHGTTAEMAAQVSAYLESLPLAPNPRKGRELTAAEQRGALVFAKAECGTCHSGERYTNNAFAHVGTQEAGGQTTFGGTFAPPFPLDGVNVPSLLGLARTAPYLHDGSAATLTERLMQKKEQNLHGKTSSLTTGEVADLVAYLERL